MHFEKRIISMLFVVAVAVVTVTAQRQSELKQKYGVPDDKGRYIVLPGVVMAPTFAQDGQPCKMTFTPRELAASDSLKLIATENVAEIIDKFAPPAQRGKRVRSLNFSASCASMISEEYEHVSIYRAVTCASGGGITSIDIHWKGRQCR